MKFTYKLSIFIGALVVFSSLNIAESYAQAGAVIYQRPSYYNGKLQDTARIKHKNYGIGLVPFSTFGSGMELSGHTFGSKFNTRLSLGLFTATNPYFYEDNNFGETETEFIGFKIDGMIKKILPIKGKYLIDVGVFATYRYGRLDNSETISTGSSSATLRRVSEAGAIIAGPVVGIYRMFDDVWFIGADLGTGLLIPVYDVNKNDLHIPVVSPFQRGAQLKANLTIGFQL